MPEIKTFKLPDVGEGLTEAEIVRWHVHPGDRVEVNQIIVEIETAKAVVELPCPYEGTVAELLVEEGRTVEVGTPIISVSVPAGEAGESAPPPAPDGTAEPGPRQDPETGPSEPARQPVLVGYGVRPGATRRRPRKRPAAIRHARPAPAPHALAKPPVRKLARDLGVDLSTVTGTGPHGTITREDVRQAAERAATSPAPPAVERPGFAEVPQAPVHEGRGPAEMPQEAGGVPGGEAVRGLTEMPGGVLPGRQGRGPAEMPGGLAEVSAPGEARSVQEGAAGPAVPSAGGREERVPVRGVRKSTAAAMVGSAFTAPQVTEFLQVDVTETMETVRRLRELPEFAELKVTPLLLVAKALLTAVRRHPMINSSWADGGEAGDEIVVRHYVNLGIATATSRGLLVPNVKDADRLTLPELAAALGRLVEEARAGRARPADLTGGTITITNIGVFGVDAGTPILTPGEAAILAFGQIRDMPWVHQGELAVRKVTTLALTFDHRIVDGELGSAVLRDIGAMLENPLRLLAWS